MSAVLLLAACGGGDSVETPPTQPTPPAAPGQPAEPNQPEAPDPEEPGPPDPAPPPPTPSTEPYVIEYYGDSTIWGWASGTSGARVGTPAPLAFANALPTPPSNEVRNRGVSGTTACDLLEGTAGPYLPWAEQMQASDATHVIVNHGINDQKVYGIQRYQSCLSGLAQAARDNGKQVVFETPNPAGDEDVASFANAMREVAANQQVPLIDQHQYLTNYLSENNLELEAIVPDGEHPSEEGYVMKGEFAADVFMGFFPRE